MRKGLFLTTAAIAAITLAGCQKFESASGLGDNDFIGFDPYISREFTKAAVTDVTASNLTTFNVACYLTGSATTYFSSEQSTSKNSDGYWETEDHYCWPESDKLDFFAYSGSGSGAVSNTGGVAKVSYTVPDAATEDFIVACAINQGKPSTYPYVQSLNFSHALSKVRQLTFVPKTGDVCANSNYRYIVTDVRITEAMNNADYSFNPVSGSNWGTASGEQDYEFEDKSFSFLGDSSHKLEVGTSTKANDQLIILPQTAIFSVTYSVEYSYDDGTTWGEVMASTTKYSEVEMEAGKSYALKFQLPVDGTPILFSSSVTGWSDAEEIDKDVETPSGMFSVSESKKVNFTKGNLYWGGDAFHLESSQTAYPSMWDTSHIGHFHWSQTASAAYAETYSDASKSSSDKFFCGEDNKLTVDGQSELYALSKDEWIYLLDTRSVNGGKGEGKSYQMATVESVYGMIIYPDDYTAQTSATSYDSATWNTMEGEDCVFLPAAGGRSGSGLYNVGSCGYYWSSTPYNADDAYSLSFFSGSVTPASNFYRDYGRSVRLVYDLQ